MLAYILLNCIPSQEENIIGDLNKIPEVIEVNVIMGKYDIIVKITGNLPGDMDLAAAKAALNFGEPWYTDEHSIDFIDSTASPINTSVITKYFILYEFNYPSLKSSSNLL